MSDVAAGLIGLAVVLLLFLTGIELGFAMALVGFVGFSYIVSWKAGLNLLAKDFFDVLSSYGFTVIPLFILMGQIAFNAGIAKRLYDGGLQVRRPHPRRAGHGDGGRGHGVQGHLRLFAGNGGHLRQRGRSGDGPLRLRQETVHRRRGHRGHPRGS